MTTQIKAAVFDVDGVLTDGRLIFDHKGRESKAFHSRDGLGLKALMRHNIEVIILSARECSAVTHRMARLGIQHVIQGREDKQVALEALLNQLGLSAAEVAYTGDDLVDWPAMRPCGLRCAPADADPWLRAHVDVVTVARGGEGAAREVCELLLSQMGQLDAWRQEFH
jgi:3-deoxy-D-manno-octulosonate 8-phosphate phosphatase (KDO 8-P phosphatase)